MSKYHYSELEKQINKVLAYNSEKASDICTIDLARTDKNIKESELLLASLGYRIPEKVSKVDKKHKPVLVVKSWESLCVEAEKAISGEVALEDLFTESELKENRAELKKINDEFKFIYKLDKYDISICAVAALVGALIDIVLVGIPQKGYDGIKGGTLSNYIRDYFEKQYPDEDMQKLANSKISKVPYDAQDNRNTTINVEGLSAYYHRIVSLGHDPLLGFVFGVLDILNGTMTTIDKNGKFVSQLMENYADRTEIDIVKALIKQINHLKSDINTSMGLPAPLMSLFNLLQLGSIGEYEQTIADIVQGMYAEGYDFIHFCSMSVPVMITELIIRIGYSLKRIKEGYSVKESIPFSGNNNKHPKLGTMLFIGHAGCSAINAGKVYFTKNPMAINYPQWIAFAKYSYTELRWGLIQKPAIKKAYIDGRINEELDDVFKSIDESFDSLSEDYIVVFE
ncbi:hypothetical protein CIY_13690 [Butyrivibrio fibrisolvens 16/4]|nr:hypothetical protein CIY_13690 [Butyrivibrio fibrisolvens 16/4]